MKKILSILVLLTVLFTFTVPAFADEGEYIIDDALVIEDIDEFIDLEMTADEVFKSEKFAVCFGTDTEPYTGELEEAARNFFADKVTYTDGVFMYLNTTTNYVYAYTDGFLKDCLTSDEIDTLIKTYINADTYYGGVKAYIEQAKELAKDVEYPTGLKMFLADGEGLLEGDDKTEVMSRFIDITEKYEFDVIGMSKANVGDYAKELAKDVEYPTGLKMFLADGEGLLEGDDKTEVMSRFIDITEKYEFDVIGMSKANVGDYAAKEAADYFEDNQYGFGESRDGIILLISKASNHEGIAALGRGESLFPDSIMDYILDEVDVYRLNGNYKQAYLRYAELVEQELAHPGTLMTAKEARDEAEAKAGMPKRIALEVGVSLVLGFLLAFIPTAVMSSKMNNVRMQDSAANYAVPGSMNVAIQKDIFLFNTVTRTKRVKESSSSGSGGTSSSGRSFSGSSR